MSEQKEIDVLVTGLPVSQYMDVERREALKSRLEGEHQITPKRSVAVKSVVVVPQPAGAYMDVVSSTKDEDLLEIIQGGKTVVIDPGFFSVDWVALEEGEVRYHSSGTSLKAMSVLLQETDRLIQEDHGGAPGIERSRKLFVPVRPKSSSTVKGIDQRLLQESLNQSRSKRLDPYAEVNA